MIDVHLSQMQGVVGHVPQSTTATGGGDGGGNNGTTPPWFTVDSRLMEIGREQVDVS